MLNAMQDQKTEVGRDAALILIAAALGAGKHQGKPWTAEWLKHGTAVESEHPFLVAQGDYLSATWVGSPGISASVTAWRQVVLQELFDPRRSVEKIGLTIYRSHAGTGRGADYNYIPEVWIDEGDNLGDRILSSGYTNYSGEGNSAWTQAFAFMAALAEMFNVQYAYTDVEPHRFDLAMEMHSGALIEYGHMQEDREVTKGFVTNS